MSSRKKHRKADKKMNAFANAYGRDNHNDLKEADIKLTDKAAWLDETKRYEDYGIKVKRNQSGIRILKIFEHFTKDKKNGSNK